MSSGVEGVRPVGVEPPAALRRSERLDDRPGSKDRRAPSPRRDEHDDELRADDGEGPHVDVLV